jgi:tetratricopeptide (TPR) repeat protein
MASTVAEATRAGTKLLAEGEAALGNGESSQAFDLLSRAAEAGVTTEELPRLAAAFASAGRYQDRHAQVLDWIERAIEAGEDPAQRVTLLRARVAVCRQLDPGRVLQLVDEAVEAAEAAGDEAAVASVLSHGSFAAYRKGNPRVAGEYAERAARLPVTSRAAQYDALRAQMFAATARGDLEAALNLTIKARAVARELGRPADAANESNNLAECYLDLGCAAEARACAEMAIRLADTAGHRAVSGFARVLCAVATAEAGEIDAGLEQFDTLAVGGNRIFAIDTASAHAYWLLERGAAGDAARAREIAERAVELAERFGVANRLTLLYSNVARSLAREGRTADARDALEKARRAADRAEPAGHSLLALAVAEVLPVSDPKRRVVLNHARARILREAGSREDPRAFCADVRINRRLLELSGGVPTDLPRAG